MGKKLLLLSLFTAISVTSFSQSVSRKTLKAIKENNTRVIENFKTEDYNKCFQIESSNSTYTYLTMSIKLENMNAVKHLVNNGADLEKVCRSKTPLMYAVKYGNLEMVKFLLENGANLNAKNNKGYTALDYAKKYRYSKIEKYLTNHTK
ncbi:ankyrin repeat domain-containing protein [Aureivirga marina]|uniref:ankyrin repeat domain-containing protein n=1 Tax=Aureivirga marina TaxID=1182451 RepID=UPI0018CAAD9C|nr:ankyrin repeat domain-containing protein [Aureivirga marina]